MEQTTVRPGQPVMRARKRVGVSSAGAPSGTPVDEVVATIQRRASSLYARGRVAETLYSLALDIVGEADLSDGDRAWLLRTLTGPVVEASQSAIDSLVSELALAVRSAPPSVRPAIVSSPVSRIDFE